ncbi:MAG: hypothetical protein B7X11_00005 [Acidobacteria bacterium 37-65-4]|nr:MAG: hypothetical protein B7X11_00005 [Acidobacteria bacterium 37-65-4]
MPAGAHFCPACGAPLAVSACPSCQKPVPTGARFCPACGAPMVAGNTPLVG